MDDTRKRLFFTLSITLVVLSFIIYQTPAFAAELEFPPADVPGSSEQEPGQEEPPDNLEQEPGPEELPDSSGQEPGLEEPPDSLGQEPSLEEPPDSLALEPGIDVNLIYEDLHSIRQNWDVFLFFVVPVLCAFYVIIKFCIWFYNTFLEGVL